MRKILSIAILTSSFSSYALDVSDVCVINSGLSPFAECTSGRTIESEESSSMRGRAKGKAKLVKILLEEGYTQALGDTYIKEK